MKSLVPKLTPIPSTKSDTLPGSDQELIQWMQKNGGRLVLNPELPGHPFTVFRKKPRYAKGPLVICVNWRVVNSAVARLQNRGIIIPAQIAKKGWRDLRLSSSFMPDV